MKLLKIPSCKSCLYLNDYYNGATCEHPDNLLERKIKTHYVFPDWCPLPNVTRKKRGKNDIKRRP